MQNVKFCSGTNISSAAGESGAIYITETASLPRMYVGENKTPVGQQVDKLAIGSEITSVPEYSIVGGTNDEALISSIVGGSTALSLLKLKGLNIEIPTTSKKGTISIGTSTKVNTSGSNSIGSLNTAGVMGFYWSSIDFTNKKITLSTNQTKAEWNLPSGVTLDWSAGSPGVLGIGKTEGDTISIVNNTRYVACAKITAIDKTNHTITVDKLPFTEISKPTVNRPDDYTICAAYYTEISGDNGIWRSRSGSVEIGYGATVLGGCNLSSGDMAFVTGFGNWGAGSCSASLGRNSITGFGSLTCGSSNKAIRENCFAGGYLSSSNSNMAFAFGRNANANGWVSTAFGKDTNANGQMSLVGGLSNTGNGDYSFTIGNANTNGGVNAIVGGYNNNSKSNGALVAGKNNTSTGGADTVLIGNGNTNNGGVAAFIGGISNTANHNQVVLFGENNTSTAINQVLIGKFSNPFSSTAFAIGNGVDAGNRSNALNVSTSGHLTLAAGITAKSDICTTGRIVFGSGSTSSSIDNLTGGLSCTNSGPRSYLGGHSCRNSGQNAIVSGFECRNESNGTLVIGNSNRSAKSNSLVAGYQNWSLGACNIIAGENNAIGKGTGGLDTAISIDSEHSYCAVFGQGNKTSGSYQLIAGKYARSDSDTLFAIGYGQHSNSPYSVFEICRSNGKSYLALDEVHINATELGHLKNTTASIQSQLDTKATVNTTNWLQQQINDIYNILDSASANTRSIKFYFDSEALWNSSEYYDTQSPYDMLNQLQNNDAWLTGGLAAYGQTTLTCSYKHSSSIEDILPGSNSLVSYINAIRNNCSWTDIPSGDPVILLTIPSQTYSICDISNNEVIIDSVRITVSLSNRKYNIQFFNSASNETFNFIGVPEEFITN